MEKRHVFITAAAGYVGSLLTGVLLSCGYRVAVLEELLFGGESLLGYWHRPDFRLVHVDVTQRGSEAHFGGVDAVVRLAAPVGFRACQEAGNEVTWRYNVDATHRVFQSACSARARRFVFASTYSNYGLASDGSPVTEQSPLHPQSFHAETKIAAEEFLLG